MRHLLLLSFGLVVTFQAFAETQNIFKNWCSQLNEKAIIAPERLIDHLNKVDFNFATAHVAAPRWILADTRTESERQLGYFESAIWLTPQTLHDKDSLAEAVSPQLKTAQKKWTEAHLANYLFFCDENHCQNSYEAACRLTKLEIPISQIYFIPLSYQKLYEAGLPLYFSNNQLQGTSTNNTVYILRLRPGMDLKKSLIAFQKNKNIQAASIVAAVGSLNIAQLRFANQNDSTSLKGPFEIVSLSGTIRPQSVHLHMSISDNKGQVIGGHLVDGNLIFTTAEITILEANQLQMSTEKDSLSNYDELIVNKKEKFTSKK